MAKVPIERSKLQKIKRQLWEAHELLKQILDEPDAAEEAPFGDDEEEASEDQPKDTRKVAATCKRCKTTGLHWTETNNGWRLFTHDGFMHRCPFYEDRR